MTDHAGIFAGQGAAAKRACARCDAIRRGDRRGAIIIRRTLAVAGRGGGRPVRATGRTLARPVPGLRIVGVA